ncbi:homoserine/threonine efflux protein (plasmid) [Streptantibioticus cattleyicolor NRRL 8057 = DSM 46488]|uniref:Homoserine/threonine efflux protein n=1 Tax=Streptantibioticus cattleyicolor (strain ATCC 35852 / DSM 46488 / JCM 4925 / NBRC 14057 / NRRL 8057) TaxID=1003195 RepID=G8XGW8_STREN|nr:homoserine/threonine efflux protein [Streptantibioticus cattleyicolor NRRL 8057 = DSM 46488]
MVTRRAVGAGRADGLRTVGGITTGLLIWGVLTVAGLAAVLAASAAAYTVVKILGAGYLLFLGVQTLLRTRSGRGDGAGEAPVTPAPTGDPWRTGLVNNMLNPKIAVFYTGLLPTLAPRALPSQAGMALLVALHAGLTLLWLGGYVLVLAKARPFFERPRVRRVLDRITGVVLIGFGVKVATAHG